MELITREELKHKIDDGDDFKLVMVLGDMAYRAKHIPGSINLTTPAEFEAAIGKDDDVVVYCASEACPASQYAYRVLKDAGYAHVRRYAGGLLEWEDAGLPIEGALANK